MVSPMPLSSSGARPSGRSDDALHAHAGFGEPQVQRVIAACSHQFINFDQVAHAAHLGAEDDLVVAQPVAFGSARGVDRAHQHRFDHHVPCIRRLGPFGILVHHPRQQSLVQRTPVHADPYRLLVFYRALDHGAEVVIVLAANRDIPWIDAVLGQRARALRDTSSTAGVRCSESLQRWGRRFPVWPSPSTIAGTATAAASLLTVTRTSSDPAVASAATCWIVPCTSAVSVLVMDCTTTGAEDPTRTFPTLTVTDCLRCSSAI